MLGANRTVTSDFKAHRTAEDYAGDHLSIISIAGSGKVIKTINSFKSHVDSINYNDFNNSNWKDGNYYNCISITGKSVRMHYSELGGNQVYIETYDGTNKLIFHFAHLDSVNVSVGDIVNSSTVIGLQGNTGLVLSSKSRSDATYGSHVHFEVTDRNGNFLNPRDYATGKIITTYQEQSNIIDKSKRQFKVLVDKINIRKEPNVLSNDIGDVYINEFYTINSEYSDDTYIWYQITTNLGISGYVASKHDSNWVQVFEINSAVIDEEQNNDGSKLIFECLKSDTYYIYLKKGEKLYIE